MHKLLMCGHGGSFNRGAEAIVKITIALISIRRACLFSHPYLHCCLSTNKKENF